MKAFWICKQSRTFLEKNNSHERTLKEDTKIQFIFCTTCRNHIHSTTMIGTGSSITYSQRSFLYWVSLKFGACWWIDYSSGSPNPHSVEWGMPTENGDHGRWPLTTHHWEWESWVPRTPNPTARRMTAAVDQHQPDNNHGCWPHNSMIHASCQLLAHSIIKVDLGPSSQ